MSVSIPKASGLTPEVNPNQHSNLDAPSRAATEPRVPFDHGRSTTFDPRSVAWLAQQIDQMCAAIVHERNYQPPLTPEATALDAAVETEEEDVLSAEMPDTVRAQDSSSNDSCALHDGEPKAATDRLTPGENAQLTSAGAGLRTGGADFWDAVAVQHASTPQKSGAVQSVFDAVGEVITKRSQSSSKGAVANAPTTQEVAQQSVDIIDAFESLLGLSEVEPLDRNPTTTRFELAPKQGQRLTLTGDRAAISGELRDGAERALFTAFTLQHASSWATTGRRG